jgi:hypothetical protein
MAYDYFAIMQAQAERLEAESAATAADLEAARQREDTDGTMYAAQRLLELDAQYAALAQRANTYVSAQQTQAQRHPSGLSAAELEVAKNSHGYGTVEERIQDYVRNKQKLAHMRATGAYRDDQGSMKR